MGGCFQDRLFGRLGLKDTLLPATASNTLPDLYSHGYLYGACSLQMLFRRYVRDDLRKTAYVAVSLRIILALIGTWAAVTAIKTTAPKTNSFSLAVLGFVIGVFPRVAWQFIQGFTKTIITKFKLGGTTVLPSLESRLPVSDLDGLTVWHESRLEEQDIENVPNMASVGK